MSSGGSNNFNLFILFKVIEREFADRGKAIEQERTREARKQYLSDRALAEETVSRNSQTGPWRTRGRYDAGFGTRLFSPLPLRSPRDP